MMTVKLQICLIIGVVIYLIIILNLIKKKRLNLKYSLLWIVTAVIMIVIAAFPKLATYVANAMGIYSVVNAVFIIAGLFALLIILSLTSIVSKQTERIVSLTQEQAILERRIRSLEDNIEDNNKEK